MDWYSINLSVRYREMHAKFFGCLYEKHEIHPHPSKVIVIKEMPALQNKEKLQNFLGMVTFVSCSQYKFYCFTVICSHD